jgi:hypothetical protein
MAPECPFEGLDQIKHPDCKRPCDRDRLERLSRQMGLLGIELTPFTGANNLLSIGYCGGPVEPLSKSFAN